MKTKRLTWEELADIYDNQTGGRARIQPMNKIFDWAERQTNKFMVDKDGCLCQIIAYNTMIDNEMDKEEK